MSAIKKSIFALLLLASSGYAEIKSVTGVFSDDKVKNIKISFLSSVNIESIGELTAAVDEINIKYPNAEKIYLFINSVGGSMDAGYIGYAAIRQSSVPVFSVNTGFIASSATLLYCAARERAAYANSFFLLHSADTNLAFASPLKPDILIHELDLLNKANNIFRNIYMECTKLTHQEIDTVLESEKNRLQYSFSQAQNKGMINSFIPDKFVYQASYIITEGKKVD